ncbi:unnamed protein product [Effrenium voratum]|uniref:Uncharacterized protein n=1 Tax=Effrenium voratum TaxID=2562239 RepID=A0AA36ML16_9DINO|nr:unnamed protein product [Effrenium voratum]
MSAFAPEYLTPKQRAIARAVAFLTAIVVIVKLGARGPDERREAVGPRKPRGSESAWTGPPGEARKVRVFFFW